MLPRNGRATTECRFKRSSGTIQQIFCIILYDEIVKAFPLRPGVKQRFPLITTFCKSYCVIRSEKEIKNHSDWEKDLLPFVGENNYLGNKVQKNLPTNC